MRFWTVILFLVILLTAFAELIPNTACEAQYPTNNQSMPSANAAIDSAASCNRGSSPLAPIDDRKMFLKHIRDSIDAIPFDTTRDDRYWERAITNGEWSFFTDHTVKLPGLLNVGRKIYEFYSRAFNDYDTAYVVGVKEDFRVMVINNDWLDSYGGMIADNNMKVFMHSNITSSAGLHFSYMGIGYTYMIDLDNVFGGDPTRHMKWDLSFATSRFSFEAYRSRNSGTVNIGRFGDFNNKRPAGRKFDGLTRVSSGIDMYYFFNHRKYSQAAAYSYSKLQRRSAGSFIAGFLVTTQNVSIDFSSLPEDMRQYLPLQEEEKYDYRYHYRSYSFLLGYAYNWVFHRNWLFNITMAPSIGWRHSFSDSVDGQRNMFGIDLRGRLGLVHNSGHFFYGLQLILDGHFFHSEDHNFINSQEDLTISVGFRF